MSDSSIRIQATVTVAGGPLAGQDGESAGWFIRTRELPGLVVAESEERCEELLDELCSLTGKALMRYGITVTSAYPASRGISHEVIAPEAAELEEGQFRREVALV